ncbi:MAG: hypothetical protein JWM68_216 [Verrucomicrobiales bacterium]|nr:hypothetical protein [Verrucomicrobiales bacterium]
MLVFTTRNAVLVALVQVAIIVLGVLAAGLSYKWWAFQELPLPGTTWLLINYGIAFLTLPVLWIGSVMWLRLSAVLSDELKGLTFLSGFILILMLLILIGHAVFAPWMHYNFHGVEVVPEETYLETRGNV